MADQSNNTAVGALMLLAGGIIGAGLALLFAPQSGKKTRKQIARYARTVRDETEELARDAARSIAEMTENFTEKTSDLVERGAEITEDWRRHLIDSIEDGQRALDKQRKKLQKLWG